MRVFGFGRALLGISVAGLAALSLAYGNFAPIVERFPAFLPSPKVWEYGSGAILLAAGVGLFFARTAVVSVVIIGVYEAAWAVAGVRPAFLKPMDVGSWYGLCEALVSLMGAWTLYALLRRQGGAPAVTAMTGNRALHGARVIIGAAFVEFGVAHFAYAAYTASMVPAWLPYRTGLVYLTGAAHAAAGLGLLFGALPRLAATLEAVMLTLFGVLVWLPTFFSRPVPMWASQAQVQWSETFLGFLLASSAWIVAASLRDTPWGFARIVRGKSAAPVI